WLQVDFEYSRLIVAIDTLQYLDESQVYVKSYKIAHSQDESQWVWYGENGSPQVFECKSDGDQAVRNLFDPPIEARLLRFYLFDYDEYASVRWELFTCE
ncbi:hypothetical protein CAPTEDRAFT_47037, partial [Capitella teleta]